MNTPQTLLKILTFRFRGAVTIVLLIMIVTLVLAVIFGGDLWIAFFGQCLFFWFHDFGYTEEQLRSGDPNAL